MKSSVSLIARMGVFIALGVALAYTPAIPFYGAAKLFPAQGAVNVIAGAVLGPLPASVVALAIAFIRIGLAKGTIMAIPGSLFGAVLAGMLYRRFHSSLAAMIGEVVGTGLIAALVAYPIAVQFLGNAAAAQAGLFLFVIPFGSSSLAGALVGGAVLAALKRTAVLAQTARAR